MTGVARWFAIAAALLLWIGDVAAQATTNPHGTSVGTCSDCHLPSGWRPVRITPAFHHAEKVFPLDGAHATAACTACHAVLDFSRAPTECAACHKDVHRGELGVNCARCHTSRSFVDEARLARLHEETRFPLRGSHAAVACESCHPSTTAGQPQFTGRPTTCVGCHRTDYDHAATPPHASAGFPTTCNTCHTETAWKGAPFDHNATQFPLTGAHQATTCTACHADGVYRGKPTSCVSCHRPDYDKTTTPPHAAAAFATTCNTCHTTTTWQGAPFDHGTTQFPLTGAHQAASCASCHADGVYRGKPTTCVSCHQPDFDKTAAPPHAAAGFATTCNTCHTTTAWQGAPFDHNTTQFPLTGAHLTVSCATCHADGVYRGKPTTCVSCHRGDFDKTTDPPHAAAGYSTDCTSCHAGTTTWQGATFDHNTTQFPLTGAHLTVSCASCHGDGVFKGKPTTCVSCHRPDYDKTTDPPHAAAGYPTDCTTCHTTNAWQSATFNHSATLFPLTGAHLTVPCASCHGDGVFAGKPTTCVSCHRADFDKTNDPPHAAAGYSTDCMTCHTGTTTWAGAVFDHNTTQFPLTGAHLAVPCATCHADGVFKGKPTTCVSCHRPDYDKTTDPPHAAAGYSTDCTTCHTGTTTWAGAVFDHNTTQFPLTGAHLAVACSACHGDGVFKGKPTTCVSCHQPQYDATKTPPHLPAGFSTSCATCHNSTSWLTATFDHSTTAFPLTGAHVAVACMTCHSDGVFKGKPTTCASCHQADYDGTTNPNHKAAFFPTTCESCHTTTTWTGATFDHDTKYFPIYSGSHRGRWTNCSDCHASSSNYAVFSCTTTCHPQASTDRNHRSVSGYRYDSNACYTCHPRGSGG